MYMEEPKIEFLPIAMTNIVCSSEDCSYDGNFGGGGVTGCYGFNPDADDMFGCVTEGNMFVF